MLSRVADSIYWMSRYIERAENVARFVGVNLHLMLDLPDIEEHKQWMPLVNVTGDAEYYKSRYSDASRENVIRFLTFDGDYAHSILSCVRAARENARSIREVISSEMWEQVNRFYQFLRRASEREAGYEDMISFFTEVKTHSHLLAGVTDATMTHGEGWNFARLGRLLERADKTSRILDVKYFILLPRIQDIGTPLDKIQWAAVLKSASGLEMYRKKYNEILPAEVAEFLLLDSEFPRAVRYCLGKAAESLNSISGTMGSGFTNLAEQRLGRLKAEFDFATIEEIMDTGLHEFIDNLQGRLNSIGDAVFQTFFALRPVSTSVP